VSRKLGITDQQIFELPRFRSTALFSDEEKTALEYAEEMTRTPVEVSEDLFARLRTHFSDDQIVELTASIAYENFRARFDHALGIGSDGLYVCAWPPPDGHPKATP
jgi:4-carboxymuconolactone decarboxylase